MLRGDNSERYAWVIGTGLPSLAAAVFMIRDAKMKGESIQVFEDAGSHKSPVYTEEKSQSPSTVLLNLLSEIPSVRNNTRSVRQEITDFPGQFPLEDIIVSLRNWLIQEGVTFHPHVQVTDIKVEEYVDTNEWVVSRIAYIEKEVKNKKEIGFEDVVVVSDARYSSEPYHNLILLSTCEEEVPSRKCTPGYGVAHAMVAIYNLLGLDKRLIPTDTHDHPFREAITKSIPDIEAAAQY